MLPTSFQREKEREREREREREIEILEIEIKIEIERESALRNELAWPFELTLLASFGNFT